MDLRSWHGYESGCREHTGCFGHMCKTPCGCILLPQSMSMRSMEIATKYYMASRLAFDGNTDKYIEELKSTNYTKNGTYRVTMSTPVAGSMRLIAVPQWNFDRKVICVSENLASKMKVPRLVYDEEGNVGGRYVEDTLREYDRVIVVRCPSLSHLSTQPLVVRFWDKDVMGIHPETFTQYHGDFDGDEIHGYPVYNKHSIQECDAWQIHSIDAFDKERGLYSDINGHSDPFGDYDTRCRFIEDTTVSARQIRDGNKNIAYGDYSRIKSAHLKSMSSRLQSPASVASSFVTDSIRGTEDIKEQQLSQGNLGDMMRVAKIIASCFYRPHSGSLYVKLRDRCICLKSDGIADPGTCAVLFLISTDGKPDEDGPTMQETTNQAIMALHRARLDPTRYIAVSYIILTQDFHTMSCYFKLEDCNTWGTAVEPIEYDIANAMFPSHITALGGFQNKTVVNIALGGAINPEIDTALETILGDEAKALMLLMKAYAVRGFTTEC